MYLIKIEIKYLNFNKIGKLRKAIEILPSLTVDRLLIFFFRKAVYVKARASPLCEYPIDHNRYTGIL